MRLVPLFYLLVAGAQALHRSGPRDPEVPEARDSSIHRPYAQHFEELIRLSIDRTRMLERNTTSPSGRAVVIATYSTKEDHWVSGNVNKGKGWERDAVKKVYDFWSSVGQRKGNFWDCGANIGTWSLPVSVDFRGTQSKVISIEGMPGIADHLRAGILANGADNIVLYPYAVGEPSEQDNITMVEDPKNKGGSAVEYRRPKHRPTPKKFTVDYTTVDAILSVEPAMKRIVVAKIDIEGNEGRMVNGAPILFSKYPPCMVIIELRDDLLNKFGTSKSSITSQFLSYGYELIGNVGGVDNFMFQQKDMAACVARLS